MVPTRARKVLGVSALLVTLLLAGFVLAQLGYLPVPWSEDDADVRVIGEDGTEKAAIDVEVADTWDERYTGLSEHKSLAEGEGMLFVHSSEDDRTYVMRDMDFDIDIIFVGEDRRINSIEHARAPEPGEDGEDLAYTGEAKWVLEVPRGYANETGMEVGDELEIDYE
ncbi:DUF192 domain-containing protein [Natrialbaceae archaeon A-gly3]